MGSRGANISLDTEKRYVVPSYAFPESTATVLAAACEYAEWLKRPKGKITRFKDIKKNEAKALIKAVFESKPAKPIWLDNTSVTELLTMYGINVVTSRQAVTAREAAELAEAMGFPVVLKLSSPTITHKTEVGGVILDLHSQTEVERAFMDMRRRLEDIGKENEMVGVTVQQMVAEGVEVIVGMTEDPSFGPIVMFGMGGVQAELFRDVTFRIHPLTDVDAHEMVRSVKAYQLLTGWRGSKITDIKALETLLLRVSTMIEDLPQIAELDLNPVKVLEKDNGYSVVDARIMLR
jgi:acetyltransferase